MRLVVVTLTVHFQRLAHNFQNVARKFRKLIEKQDAVVGQ
jgi:hypothetical protein